MYFVVVQTTTAAVIRDHGVIGEQNKLTKQTIINPLKLFIYMYFGLEKLKMSNINSTNIVYTRLSNRSKIDMFTSSASLNESVYSHNYV